MDIAINKKLTVWQLNKEKLRKLLSNIEVDRAVFFGILTKLWSLLAAPVTALLIVIKFTPEIQGYYYTFNSLLALQVFVELGFGTVIIQFASHEWSKLKIDNAGEIIGDKKALSRLVSLANITSRWYLVGGIIIAFGLGFTGYQFFLKSQNLLINWQLPWLTLCFLSGITVFLISIWSLLEGCNQVSSVYTYRFIRGIIASMAIWIAIFSGATLWSATISVVATILYAIFFLKNKYSKFLKSLLLSKPADSRINWRKEILPMQWRIALSWASGYFVFALFTPVIFYYYGAVIAGQFGMVWSVIASVSTISSAWLMPKIPQFGILIAKKEYIKLDQLFWRITKVYIIISALVSVGVGCLFYLINVTKNPFSSRLLPIWPTIIFLTAQMIMSISMPFSMYLIAHKRNPIFFLSVLSGIIVGLSTFVLGKYYSVTAVGLGYLVINLLLIPFVIYIWRRCRKQWHVDNPVVMEV